MSIIGPHSPGQAIDVSASDHGAYSDYMDFHNYGYVLKYGGQINVAVYDAELIFHLKLPEHDVRLNERFYNC